MQARHVLSPACLCLLVAMPAHAASVPQGFSSGLAGPLLTYVHLLGLLGLGLWLDMQGRGTPGGGTVAALLAGLGFALLTRAGVVVPYAALALEASLLVLGGLLVAGVTLPRLAGLAGAAIVGALHGISLSQWGGPVTRHLLFWPGMLTGCLLLVTAGVGLSATLYPLGAGKASRILGVVIGLVGLLMLLNVL
ncbi:HupE/UreJ family protein [Niveispirillum fermenti]|uniref:HupE/UreJ family protein n=1 Tax=Niveispirillum fermenti TaxID=1233113 RepID=UPI003A8564CB